MRLAFDLGGDRVEGKSLESRSGGSLRNWIYGSSIRIKKRDAKDIDYLLWGWPP